MNYYNEAAIRFDDRPFRDLEEMHTEIVKRWNEKVNNGDTVYRGDVSMRGKNEDLIALVAILKGKKDPCNHELFRDPGQSMTCPTSDTDSCFSEVCDYKEIRDS